MVMATERAGGGAQSHTSAEVEVPGRHAAGELRAGAGVVPAVVVDAARTERGAGAAQVPAERLLRGVVAGGDVEGDLREPDSGVVAHRVGLVDRGVERPGGAVPPVEAVLDPD